MATVTPPGVSGREIRKDLMVKYIEEYLKKNGIPPTLREIAPAVGLDPNSFGTVRKYANELIEEGRLKRGRGKRNLTTTRKVDIS